ncbi:MAG TPA: Rne/Rng family ribonuclease [Candidatus Pelagibacter sp.]|nr:Rne/Rng family ribonuclease [Candidatus Pelagibacter sp.]
MEKNLYIDASHPDETRVILKSENYIEEYEYENKNKLHIKNNIYLGKVSRIEPSLQAAFVNYGNQRHGFLAFNDIQSDYYQMPHDDKERLKKEEERLRLELKEKSKKNEDVEKPFEENENLITSEDKTNGSNGTDDKTKNEYKPIEKNNQINDLKKRYGIRRYKIQEVIKPEQIVLVQILKDERGQKGAALTTFISLAGKYSVLMPNTSKGGGISRKITNSDDRKKIRSILQQIKIPETMGLIVRTAGLNKTKNEIEKDISNTVGAWEDIKTNAIKSIAPSLVYEEGDVIKRALRDMYDNETKNVIVEGNEGFQKTKNFMKLLMPENVKKVKKYRGKIPLFHEVGIEKDLNRIFDQIIKLKSGGYLVINPTEALVSIDINSGQSIKEVNIEKTALKTNLEAAEEISRQIKIRDLSGLIVIDFIDMLSFYNRKLVERKLREKLRDDRARTQFGRISNFGLLEMTRQRLKESSVRWRMTLTLDSFALKIVKKSEELAFSNKAKIINIYIPEKVKKYIEENLSKELNYFGKKYKLEFILIADKNLILPEYKIDLLNKNKKIITKIENFEKIEKNFIKPNFKRKGYINKKFNKNRKKYSSPEPNKTTAKN